MDSFPSSEPTRVARGELALLQHAVHGDGRTVGLATVLPLLQSRHRKELRTEPRWSKEELVRHPEPRELIRSMRKAGNLDEQGRPLYTLDERRSLTANIYENRLVRDVIEDVRSRLRTLRDDQTSGVGDEAGELLKDLEGARRQAPFLDEVVSRQPTALPTTTLTQDPLYRTVLGIRVRLAG
jgi:hypothetical protein